MIPFDKNVGEYLRGVFANGSAAHAYVVVGEKQYIPALLKECAMVTLCPDHLGCDCETCKKVVIGAHQDVINLPADSQKNRLTVADISYLVEESYKRPVDSGERRVFLVNAVSSVAGVGSDVWQNKLLKTLEEPQDGVYIFIGVSDAESLLPTVRSRCQIIKQNKLSIDEVKTAVSGKGFDERSCEMAAALSGGSVETAESLLLNSSAFKSYETALDAAMNMTSTKNALLYASRIVANRDCVYEFLSCYVLLLRESIIYRLQPDLVRLPAFSEEINKICANYTLSAAVSCIERLDSAKKRLDGGANLAVSIDRLLTDLLQIRYLCREER